MLINEISDLGPRLLDLLPQIVWTAQPDGGLDYYNQRWFDYTGLSMEQTRNWGWKPVLHPDDLDQCVERWTTAIETGAEYEVEYRFKRACDGAYRWHLGRAHPLRNELGQIVKWFGTCTDIDDQKQVQHNLEMLRNELDNRVQIRTADLATANALLQQGLKDKEQAIQALLASELRFSSIVGSSSAGIITSNDQGIIVSWNTSAEVLFGYSAHEAIGSPLSALVPECFRERHHVGMARVAAGEPSEPIGKIISMIGLRKDGSQFPLELSLSSWMEGTHRFFGGVIQDVTERSRVEDELRAREEFKRRVLDSSGDCIKVLDFDGHILSINGPGRSLLEMDPEVDLVGSEWVNFWSGADAELAKAAVDAARDGHPGRFTGFCVTCKGSARWWDVAVTPILNKAGHPDHLLVSSRDVTALKHTQDALEKARTAAESATKAKGEFLANMSHEIRTPMNGVLGMLTLLQDTPLLEDQRVMAQTASNSAEALLAIIDDILDYSKIESGKMQFEEKDFDPRSVADDCIRLLRPSADDKNLTLAVIVEPLTPTSLRGDSGRFRQVILNLLGNALKFTKSGKVAISLSARDANRDVGDVFISVSISDSGIGMDLEKCQSLFKPFVQADASISRRFGGSGLGLAISHRLCGLMGGGITVESTLGVGSTFTASFFFKKGLLIAGEKKEGRELPRFSGRVLIVDDNKINQLILLNFCKKIGLDVEVAENGIEAIEALTAMDITLVLMDCQMPVMDGFEATRRIRQHEGIRKHIPIIAVTASVFEQDVQACIAAGMDMCLAKPVRIHVLAAAIGKVLQTASP